MISCQQEEIVKDNSNSGSGKQKVTIQKGISLSEDMVPDGGLNGGGGEWGTTPPAPSEYRVYPFIKSGKENGLFSSTGSANTSDIVAFAFAENGDWYPMYDVLQGANVQSTWLWLGANHVENQIRFMIRGFPIHTAQGYPYSFVPNARVQVCISGASASTYSLNEYIKRLNEGGSKQLLDVGGVTTFEGKMTVTNFSINSEGRLSFTYTFTLGNRTFTVSKNNFARVH